MNCPHRLVMPDSAFLWRSAAISSGSLAQHAQRDHSGRCRSLFGRGSGPVYDHHVHGGVIEAKRRARPGAPEVPVTVVRWAAVFRSGPSTSS